MAKIQHVYLYDDRTNEVMMDLCEEGIGFFSYSSIEKLLHYMHIEGCSRIEAESYRGGEFSGEEYSREVYYYSSKGWGPVNNSVIDILGLNENIDEYQTFYRKGLYGFEEYNNPEENIEVTEYNELSFWKYRTLIQRILIDIDPIHVARFPFLKKGRTLYAIESYDIAKAIYKCPNEAFVRTTIQSAMQALHRMELSENEIGHFLARLLHGEKWHMCPVCKGHYFYEEKERCPICGWVYNLKQENNCTSELSSDNAEPLRLRQIYYYLSSNESTKEEANCIWNTYEEAFNSLIKIRKMFPKENDHYSVLFDGVNIQDNKYLDEMSFEGLREKTLNDLIKLFVEKCLLIEEQTFGYEQLSSLLYRKLDIDQGYAYALITPLIKGNTVTNNDLHEITIERLKWASFISEREKSLLDKHGLETIQQVYECGTEIFETNYIGIRSSLKVIKIFQLYSLNIDVYTEYIDKNEISIERNLKSLSAEDPVELRRYPLPIFNDPEIYIPSQIVNIGDIWGLHSEELKDMMLTQLYDYGVDIDNFYRKDRW